MSGLTLTCNQPVLPAQVHTLAHFLFVYITKASVAIFDGEVGT